MDCNYLNEKNTNNFNEENSNYFDEENSNNFEEKKSINIDEENSINFSEENSINFNEEISNNFEEELNNNFNDTSDFDTSNSIDNDLNGINGFNHNNDSDSSDYTDYVDDILEENITKVLWKNSNNARKRKREFKVRNKVKNVLIKRGKSLFEILPEDWVEITHYTGIPIYLNKKTRVCCTTKPYFIGKINPAKHEIPISAIPCFQYKKELEKEQELNAAKTLDPIKSSIPAVKVETVKDKFINHKNVIDYCKQLFEFKTVTMKKFAHWAERRKYEQAKKKAQSLLPESTKLITLPKINSADTSPSKKEFVINLAGKSSVCILHEYVQHTEHAQPKYRFEDLVNASKPFSATVFINDIEYGNGIGCSKREAKEKAARASLNILIPDLKIDEPDEDKNNTMDDINFFDDISIEDERIPELCFKTGQYLPYQSLYQCIKRTFGFDHISINTSVKLLNNRIEYTMAVGSHQVTVNCKNKRHGKQLAAQKIIQLLHPNLKTYGSILKLYGQGSVKSSRAKREEEQKITELQSIGFCNKPNFAILEKLREEMLKLRDNVAD